MAESDPLSLLEPAATRVRDPVSGRSVWLAGLVQEAKVEAGTLRFSLVVQPEHAPADRAAMAEAVVANLRGLGFDGPVEPRVIERPVRPVRLKREDPVPGMSGPGMAPHGGPVQRLTLPGVKHIVAVASGKGGVGKSTVAANLAVGLRKLGLTTGLLDADIYGPSVHILMNVSAKPVITSDKKVVPPLAYGVKCLSMGLVVDPGEAMIWRGPMVMDLVRKLLQDTAWGPLDVLVVDLPPGTGDAQLTLIQAVELAGAVVVTTPQEVALADAVRGLRMFEKLGVPRLGLVENMAYYLLPDGTRDHVFGKDGGKRTAEAHGVELLGELPLRTAIRHAGDTGLPTVLGKDVDAEVLLGIARRVAVKLGLLPAA